MTKAARKPNPHKLALIEKSQEAKQLRKLMVESAETPEEREAAENLGINQLLMLMHENDSGQTKFLTFHDWKKIGFKVKKGESAYRIWSKPRRAKKTFETEEGDMLEAGEFKYFGMCCLFHIAQVEPIDDSVSVDDISNDIDNNTCNVVQLPAIEPKNESDAKTVESPFVCSGFDERADSKKERLLERAENSKNKSNALYQSAKDMASSTENVDIFFR